MLTFPRFIDLKLFSRYCTIRGVLIFMYYFGRTILGLEYLGWFLILEFLGCGKYPGIGPSWPVLNVKF